MMAQLLTGAQLRTERGSGDGHVTGRAAILPALERLCLLSGVSTFRRLSPSQLIPLAVVADTVAFRAGAPIIRRGEPADGLYVVIAGYVAIHSPAPDGASGADHRATAARYLGAGGVVGEEALRDAPVAEAGCTAAAGTLCLYLSRARFQMALNRDGCLRQALAAPLSP